MSRRAWVAFGVMVAAVIGIDQWSKALVRSAFDVGESMPLIDGFLWLTHVHNTGAAFGMLKGQQFVLVLVALVVTAVIVYALVKLRPRSVIARVSLALVMGGAIGNLIDRVIAGGVTDFFDLGWFPVFNIADACLDVGAVILVAWLLFGRHEHALNPTVAPEKRPDARSRV